MDESTPIAGSSSTGLMDPVLAAALEGVVKQAAGHAELQGVVAGIHDLIGDTVGAARYRSMVVRDGLAEFHAAESDRLRQLAIEANNQLIAGTTDLTARDVAVLSADSHRHAVAARRHNPRWAILLLHAALDCRLPKMFFARGAGAGSASGDGSTDVARPVISTTSDLGEWFAARCHHLVDEARHASDDMAAAEAIEAWCAIRRAMFIEGPLSDGAQYFPLPEAVLREVADLTIGAIGLGLAATSAAYAAGDWLDLGARGAVTRQLTGPQLWSAAITRFTESKLGECSWWGPTHFAERTVAGAIGVVTGADVTLWPETRLVAASGDASTDGALRFVDEDMFNGLTDGQVISFVVAPSTPERSGVCLWPPESYEELHGPLPSSPVPQAVHNVAELLGVRVRSAFDSDGYYWVPPPRTLGLGIGPTALPEIGWWQNLAQRCDAAIEMVTGTISSAGLQMLIAARGGSDLWSQRLSTVDDVRSSWFAIGVHEPPSDEQGLGTTQLG